MEAPPWPCFGREVAMSRKGRTTLTAVEKLIEQRRLFQDWLAKVEAGVDGMPPHVVERVRNDYRSRLEAVLAELGEHQDALQQALDEAEGRRGELEAQLQARRDELAELKLRQHVGEVDEQRFSASYSELQGALDSLSRDISAAERDIGRYEEILDVIVTPAPAPAPPPAPPPAPARAPEPVAEAPAAGGGVRPRPSEDELAFLRSVTGQGGAKPSSRSATRTQEPQPRAAPESRSSAAPQSAQALAAVEEVGINPAPNLVELPPAEPEPAPPARESAARKPSGGTVKEKKISCGECGAQNLPTEWYCEKCGAELSAF
jgi:hypothetical protein